MPYYCTVPRCTSMAGKAANVSFHQFPRDPALAERWNLILKRGKPYTKYSKVCSLHFTPVDYTMTSVGKNKGHWRTLRKDAVPSQNLPNDSPTPYRPRAPRGDSEHASEQQMQQQLAHAVYVQTMLAVHAANVAAARPSVQHESPDASDSEDNDSAEAVDTEYCTEANDTRTEHGNIHNEVTHPRFHTEHGNHSEVTNRSEHNDMTDAAVTEECTETRDRHFTNDKHGNCRGVTDTEWYSTDTVTDSNQSIQRQKDLTTTKTAFKCELCSKCFKDPDVFLLHKRWHTHSNNHEKQDDLLNKMINPLNADLDCRSVPNPLTFDPLNLEHQILLAMRMNMETYIKTMASVSNGNETTVTESRSDDNDKSDESNEPVGPDSADEHNGG